MKENTTSSNLKNIFVISILSAALILWMLLTPGHSAQSQHNEHEQDGQEEQVEKGPHGGRLLTQDDFSLEITIYETGLPPEFRVYVYQNKQPVEPNKVKLDIDLNRLGDKIDHIQFTAQENYLRGNATIYEPHSFEVKANVIYQGKSYSWHYQNFEGRTQILKSMAAEMEIKTEFVGSATLLEKRTLTGRVHTNPNRLSHVR
ncbi:MAG: secretion protein HlyD, partial [Gammaproteobacteria bacterium]|nr:secretion protein HlyD [Gammaproteobacteria bacterium]